MFITDTHLQSLTLFVSQELMDCPNATVCDVIGLLTFSGRPERIRSRGEGGHSHHRKKCFFYLDFMAWIENIKPHVFFIGRKSRGGAYGVSLAETGGWGQPSTNHGEALLHIST